MKRILIALVGMLLAVSFSITAGARQISTSARCESGADCNIGDGKPTGITLDTDGADLNLEGTTTNTLTLTAATTGTAVFTGADAAGAANTTYTTTGTGTTTLDTGGASAIVIGSADVTDVTINSNTGITFADGGDSINNTADDVFDFTRDDAGIVTLTCSDDNAVAGCTYDAGGASPILIGSADVTTIGLVNTGAINVGVAATDSITLVTDGGTVTVDGYVQGDVGPFITLASGNLTVNTIHIATAAATYTIPACIAANVGEWVTVIVQDVSEVVVLDLADASNKIKATGADIDAGHVIDSGASATGDGDFITLVCAVAEFWFSTAMGGVWVDGGSS